MRPDPKFGWHVYCIVPLIILGSMCGNIISRLVKWIKTYRREKNWTPEQRRVQVLVGIRKKEYL